MEKKELLKMNLQHFAEPAAEPQKDEPKPPAPEPAKDRAKRQTEKWVTAPSL